MSSEAACSGILVVELTGSLVTVSDAAGLSFATASCDPVVCRVSIFVLFAVTSVGSRVLVCGTSLNASLFVKNRFVLFKADAFLSRESAEFCFRFCFQRLSLNFPLLLFL